MCQRRSATASPEGRWLMLSMASCLKARWVRPERLLCAMGDHAGWRRRCDPPMPRMAMRVAKMAMGRHHSISPVARA